MTIGLAHTDESMDKNVENFQNVGLGLWSVHHSKLGKIFRQKFLHTNFCCRGTTEMEGQRTGKGC